MASTVSKCSVKTCKYYSNNDCNAPSIEVNFDNSTVQGNKNEETQCKTFQPNGSQR